MKNCTKCGKEKSKEKFNKDTRKLDGLRCRCQICEKEYRRNNKERTKEYGKKYRENNKEKIRKYKENNKEKIRSCNREYYKHNKKKKRKYNKKYIEEYKQTPDYKWSVYKTSAKKRKLELNLTFEEFITFWQKPCSYCGDKILTIGLDRVNNMKGYSMKNVTSCCTRCNKMKLQMTRQKFIEACQKIVESQRNN